MKSVKFWITNKPYCSIFIDLKNRFYFILVAISKILWFIFIFYFCIINYLNNLRVHPNV
jgi:hypothetical protein